MSDIYLARHGQSTQNRDRVISGQLDPSLTTAGIYQAYSLGEQAALLGIKVILSSPQTRAIQTSYMASTMLGEDTMLRIDKRLRERFLGEAEGKDRSYFRNFSQPMDIPGIEADNKIVARASSFLDEIQEFNYKDPLLIIAHSGIIRVFRIVSDDTLSMSDFLTIPKLKNGAMFKL